MSTPQASTKYYEQRFVNDFHEELKRKKISLPVTVVLKDSNGNEQVIRNVSGARVLRDKANAKSPTKIKIENIGRHVTSKGDIALYSIVKDGNKEIKVDVAWISHKSNKNDIGKKIDHAQYLDASADVTFRTRPAVTKEIRDFKNKMLKLSVQESSNIYCWPGYKDGKSLRIWDYVKSSLLMNMAIFGIEYGTGKGFSRQNANILMSGDPHIEIHNDNTIILTTKGEKSANSFEGKSFINGTAEYMPDDDKPIFFTKPTTSVKTTIEGKRIDGVSVWIIYRSYATKNKMIDDVINNKNAIVSSTCYSTRQKESGPKKPKGGKSTNITYNDYNVYFDDKKENPYAAFFYMNNTSTLKPIKYNVIRTDDAYVNFLKKHGKHMIPRGKVINPETGRFVQEKSTIKRSSKENIVKSKPLSAFFKPLRSSPSKSSTNTSPIIRNVSPRRLQNLALQSSIKSVKPPTPQRSPLPDLLSPTLPQLPKTPSPVKSSSSIKNTSNMNTGFYHISKTTDRQIKSKIFYMPLKKRFYYVLPTGKPQVITNIHKYIPENRLKTLIG